MDATLEKPDLESLMAQAAAADAPKNDNRSPGTSVQRWKIYRPVVTELAGKDYSVKAITEWFVERKVVKDDRPKEGDWRQPPGEFWNAYQAFARMVRESGKRREPLADR